MVDIAGIRRRSFRRGWQCLALTLWFALAAGAAPAETPGAAPAANYLNPIQLGEVVAPIALYPDDLLALVLAAATEPLQIIDAWRYLETVRALPTLAPDEDWDDAVVALLNYPEVVERMNRELEWTVRLGDAVRLQQEDVIAAVAEFRARAQATGNLTSNAQQLVSSSGSTIQIQPANPSVVYVPYYEPARVLVYQSAPAVSFHPRPYPLYHYPYAGGYPNSYANFWGVGSSFSIAWGSRRLRVHDHGHFGRYGRAAQRPGHFHRGHHDDRYDGRGVRERPWQAAARRRGADGPARTWSRTSPHSGADRDDRARWSRGGKHASRLDRPGRREADDARSGRSSHSERQRHERSRDAVTAATRARQMLPEPVRGNRGLSPLEPRATAPPRAGHGPTHRPGHRPGAYTRAAPRPPAASRPNWTRPQAAGSSPAAAPRVRREAPRRDAASARFSRGAASQRGDGGRRSRSRQR